MRLRTVKIKKDKSNVEWPDPQALKRIRKLTGGNRMKSKFIKTRAFDF